MLFAGALGAQLIAAFEPQAGFWPLAALFGLGLLVLLAGGKARGWGLWLLLGAALGLAFSARTGAQFDALTAAYGGRAGRLPPPRGGGGRGGPPPPPLGEKTTGGPRGRRAPPPPTPYPALACASVTRGTLIPCWR